MPINYSPANPASTVENIGKKKISIYILGVFFFSIIQTVVFHLILGRIGYLFSSIVTGLLIIFLVSTVLGLITRIKHLVGLFIFTMFFLNVDVFSDLTGLFSGAKLSWVLLAPFILYTALSAHSIYKTILNHKIVLGIIFFGFMQMGWAIIPGLEIFLNILQRWLFYLAVVLATVNFAMLSRNHIRSLAYMIVLAGLNASVMLILEYLYPTALGISVTVGENTQRAGGLYGHSGAAAFVVSFSALVLCWLVFARQFPRLYFWPIILIMLWALIITFSTQGIISLALIGVGLGLSGFPRGFLRSSIVTVSGVAMAVLTLILLSAIIFNSGILTQVRLSRDNARRLENMRQVYSGNIGVLWDEMVRSNRINRLEYSWQAIQKEPWWGYGTGISKLYGKDETLDNLDPYRPHNVFMMVWIENGIFVTLFIGLLFLFIIVKNLISKEPERWFRYLVIVNMFAFMFARHILFYYRYTAITLAIMLVIDKISFQTEKKHEVVICH